ncbi:hypothetical protein D0Z00_003450 [Geotrichum galactomycetum]|uniref:Uncharacterized protein n=1 Tax=Geotrichum galactomycetum TaxID=27317 RepID=A0ACB6V143_9ASCO|nr:hypothetical protein D0Z00_003450 [Geotrichum candidum]
MSKQIPARALSADLKSLLKPRRHFDRVPAGVPYNVAETRSQLRDLHIPNYVSEDTRPAALRLYRALHRSAARQMDPLTRYFLRTHIWEHTEAYRHITEPEKIAILLRDGQKHLQTLQMALTRTAGSRAAGEVLEYALKRYRVEEGPLSRLFQFPRLEPTLAIAVRHLQIPSGITTYDAYASAVKAEPGFYFEFANFLKRTQAAGLDMNTSGTKIVFEPFVDGTVHGTPLSPSRQKNKIKKHIGRIIESCKKPVDESVLVYLEHMIRNTSSFHTIKLGQKSANGMLKAKVYVPATKNKRVYIRRLTDFLEQSYVLVRDKQTGRLRAVLPSVGRMSSVLLADS